MSAITPGRPVRVGVIEDNALLRAEICELLADDRELVVVGAAADAASGLELILAELPDVVLVDVGLPDRRGDDLTASIVAAFPSVRVVAHTAADDRSTALAMLRAGAAGFAVKGRHGTELNEIVKAAARGTTYVDDEVTKQILPDLVNGLTNRTAGVDERSRRWTRHLLDRGELAVALQPIVDLRNGTVVGAEALLRTTGPERFSPSDIFARAIAGGVALELELWSATEACRQRHRLPEGAYLSVNASPGLALTEGLLDLVDDHAGPTLVVEITEHHQVPDYAAMARAMRRLRSNGTRVAVDDAGAGFSSLQHILELEPDIIKLDRELIKDIGGDRRRRALVRALVAYAAEIGSTIVAEGIETRAELLTLTELGIGFGQGYLLQSPTLGALPGLIDVDPWMLPATFSDA